MIKYFRNINELEIMIEKKNVMYNNIIVYQYYNVDTFMSSEVRVFINEFWTNEQPKFIRFFFYICRK